MPLTDDGLPVSEVGQWAFEKHDRLRRYVDIARGVRKGFVAGAGATYLDLFCGPGRSRVTGTGQLILGSPLVAALKAREGGAPFNRILICDAEAATVGAASTRLARENFTAESFVGRAEDQVDRIAASLNGFGLHFAFLDPFNLDDLPFSIIARLAQLKRMDKVREFVVNPLPYLYSIGVRTIQGLLLPVDVYFKLAESNTPHQGIGNLPAKTKFW